MKVRSIKLLKWSYYLFIFFMIIPSFILIFIPIKGVGLLELLVLFSIQIFPLAYFLSSFTWVKDRSKIRRKKTHLNTILRVLSILSGSIILYFGISLAIGTFYSISSLSEMDASTTTYLLLVLQQLYPILMGALILYYSIYAERIEHVSQD